MAIDYVTAQQRIRQAARGSKRDLGMVMTSLLNGVVSLEGGGGVVLPPEIPGVERWRLNFAADTYTVDGVSYAASDVVSYTRSGVAYARRLDDVHTQFAANTLKRTDRGVIFEPTKTNVVKYNRDLTNAFWTKTNATVAKDQVGIDGVANAASSMTATADNATVTQAITISAANRWFSAFFTRLAGPGALTVTLDGTSYYPAIQIEGDRYFVMFPTGLYYESRTNPVVGFQMATSGDKWRVDGVQLENSSIGPSTPIFTTSVSASRSAETLSLTDLTRLKMSMRRGTLLGKFRDPMAIRAIGTYPQIVNARIDAANKVGVEIGTGIVDASNPPPGWTSADAGFLQAFIPYKDGLFAQKQYSSGLTTYGQQYKFAVSWAPNQSLGAFSNGSASLKTEAASYFDDTPPVFVGVGNNNSGQAGQCYVEELVYYDGIVSQSVLDIYVA